MFTRLTRFVLMSLGISAGEEDRQTQAEEKWARQREIARREEERKRELLQKHSDSHGEKDTR